MIQKRNICLGLTLATLLGLMGCGENIDSRDSELIKYEPKLKLGKDRDANYPTAHKRKSEKQDNASKTAEEQPADVDKKSE